MVQDPFESWRTLDPWDQALRGLVVLVAFHQKSAD
jgi:hypothetical protein